MDKSIVAAWCYYCKRCNYIWFPKDHSGYDTYGDKDEIIDNGILDRVIPQNHVQDVNQNTGIDILWIWNTIIEVKQEMMQNIESLDAIKVQRNERILIKFTSHL